MKFSAEIKKIATGYYVLIPAGIRKMLDVKEGSFIELDVTKLQDMENIKTYKCLVCEHTFSLNSKEELYCPACENEHKDSFELIDEIESGDE